MTDLLNDTIERREPHPVPEWVERVCADFGVSDSGTPKYRVIWNPDRTRLCFGRLIRKYPRLGERWILEVLLPWELYGRWHEEAFGPKPADGDYCHSHTFQQTWEGEINILEQGQEAESEYLSLDDFGQDNLRLLLACVEKGKAVQAWQLRNHDEEQLALEEKEFHEQFENVYDDSMGELEKVEKLSASTGISTSLDPLPEKLKPERERVARASKKQIIH